MNTSGLLHRLFPAVLALALTGCAVYRTEPITSNPKVRVVHVDGTEIWVAPYSDGTWGATDSKTPVFIERNPAQIRPKLARAIEEVSGCKVIDAEYMREWSNLFAAVDCRR